MRGRSIAFGGSMLAASIGVLAGLAVAAQEPSIEVSPSSHSFGSLCAGATSASKTFRIKNGADLEGGQDLEIQNISRSGSADFSYTDPTDGGPVTLQPQQSVTFSVTFKPPSLSHGNRTATFTIESPDATDKTVSVTGTALDRRFSVDRSSVSFGEQRVKTRSPTQTVAVRNNGADTVTVTSVVRRGTNAGDFLVTPPASSFTISPGTSRTVAIAFQPNGTGLRRGAVDLLSNACSNARATVGLVGTGVVPNVVIEPNPVEVGSSPQGKESKPVTVTVSNDGRAPLKITAIQVIGTDAADFSLQGLPVMPLTVPPAGIVEFQVRMTPSSEGLRTASINVLSDDPDAPAFAVPLRGSAGAASTPPSARPTTSSPASPSSPPSGRSTDDPSPQAIAPSSNDSLAVGIVVGGAVVAFGGLLLIRRLVGARDDDY